ncbi:YfcC family protein [Kribbella sp. NBC_01484]|uniref:YfcC family protein n=1 Tax=Kribbella sp. NBC_01484 TaxID=2903579 RepID=UPI002E353709|nr:Na+/H+ antiporter NhaC family protein [Kribbella sp. NBC_01484]
MSEVEQRRKFRFPTAFTVLAGVLLLVWFASFFVPAGHYQLDKDGAPVPGTYQKLPSCSAPAATASSLDVPSPGESGVAPADAASAPGATVSDLGVPCVDDSLSFRFKQLWNSPANGLYGVESGKGFVGPWEEGFLYGSAAIFLFVLAVGAFITVTMKTEAIQTGIGRLALRFRRSGSVLVGLLMAVFALGGTSYGMWEETLGFFVLLVPLALALGYDRMVAAAIIFLGAGSGVIASTVNPFATGVASDAAGVSIGDGIGLRIAMWVVIVAMAIGYVLRYAGRVRRDAAKSVVGVSEEDALNAQSLVTDVPALTRRQGVVLVLFGFTFLLMIYGFIPWNDIWGEAFNTDFPLPTFHDFYFPEAATLFIVMAVVIGLIARLGEEGTVTTIVAGASDFLGAGLIIVVARGITVVMKNSYMTDTILHKMESAVSGTSSGVFAIVAFVVNIPIAFLVPSSSGHAALVMPILAPLADFAHVSRSIVVTCFQSASGLVNIVTPTSAVIMGGLALSKVGYDRYLRFVWPFILAVFVVICAFVGIAAALD